MYVSITFCLSINVHLSFFHILAIVINSTMNIGVKFLFESLLSVLFSIYPDTELLESVVILTLNFLHKRNLFG